MRIFTILLLSVLIASCDANRERHYIGMDYRNFNGTIAEKLAKAVIREDVEDIREELTANNIPVDYKEPNYGQTLLHIAVMNMKEKSVETLLDLGADPEGIPNESRSTPNVLTNLRPRTLFAYYLREFEGLIVTLCRVSHFNPEKVLFSQNLFVNL